MSNDKENKEAFLRYVTRLEAKCDNALKQRDALLDACKTGLAYVYAIISKVPRSIQDLREDKEQLEAAIKLCERK